MNKISNTLFAVSILITGFLSSSWHYLPSALDPIELYPLQQNVNCPDDPTGMAAVAPTGGTPPFTFLWSTGATTVSVNSLTAGLYGVTVTDAAGCTAHKSFLITANTPVSISIQTTDAACTTDPGGTASVTVEEGAGPFTYEWDTGETTASLTGLLPGNYVVTMTDANGCKAFGTAVVGGNLANTVAIQFGVQVLLEGALIATENLPGGTDSTMRNTLRYAPQTNPQYQNLIPAAQPYNVAPWNYSGSETANFNFITDQIVDWVLLTVRKEANDPGSVVFQRAVLLRTDGHVMTASGQTVQQFSFAACGEEELYLVIEHRSHLPTLAAIPLVDGVTQQLDLRNNGAYPDILNSAYLSRKDFGTGWFAMFTGNGEQTNSRSLIDQVNDTAPLLADFNSFGVYSPGDYNLDGDVNSNDSGVLIANINVLSQIGF